MDNTENYDVGDRRVEMSITVNKYPSPSLLDQIFPKGKRGNHENNTTPKCQKDLEPKRFRNGIL